MDEPTARTLHRQAVEARQLTLALGEEKAEGLVFRFALEASAAAGVERVVFLALRGDEGQVECFWPVPLVVPSTGRAGTEPVSCAYLVMRCKGMSCSAIGHPRPPMNTGSATSWPSNTPEGQDDLSTVAAPEGLSHPGGETARRRSLAWHAKMRPLLLDLCAQGLSNKQIADVLNQRGIRTQLRARWRPDHVRKLIMSPPA
ncbi:recombinase family protein [Lichenicoccus roseus]|uniref:Recombinase domain-containing protein n=1 Tax=Lichenicoccus roseus TaxID=2683649 RepID=A0A5R9J0P2_9PROT|nr:recombinase family protein [Lichenicoccus roseus]TLU70509.1 hypothetical protein FE263_21530 [Lichenicoccus roseus]